MTSVTGCLQMYKICVVDLNNWLSSGVRYVLLTSITGCLQVSKICVGDRNDWLSSGV